MGIFKGFKVSQKCIVFYYYRAPNVGFFWKGISGPKLRLGLYVARNIYFFKGQSGPHVWTFTKDYLGPNFNFCTRPWIFSKDPESKKATFFFNFSKGSSYKFENHLTEDY